MAFTASTYPGAGACLLRDQTISRVLTEPLKDAVDRSTKPTIMVTKSCPSMKAVALSAPTSATTKVLPPSWNVSAPQTPFFPGSLRRDQMLSLEIPGQEGLEVFDSGRGR